MRECPLCMAECTLEQFPHLRNCPHLFCMECLHTYVKIEIQEGRANLKCPQCTELMHPNGKKLFKNLHIFGRVFLCSRNFVCLCLKIEIQALIHHRINSQHFNAVFSNFFTNTKSYYFFRNI